METPVFTESEKLAMAAEFAERFPIKELVSEWMKVVGWGGSHDECMLVPARISVHDVLQERRVQVRFRAGGTHGARLAIQAFPLSLPFARELNRLLLQRTLAEMKRQFEILMRDPEILGDA